MPPSRTSLTGRRAALRFGLLAAVIVALAVAAARSPLHRLPDAIAALGWAAPVVGTLIGALLLCALVPRTAISLACGVLFGAIGGGVVAVIAALLAAAVTFVGGRRLGRDAVARWAGARWSRLDAWLTRRGLLAVTAVRFIPIAPFGLVGYAYGTTSVHPRHYAAGTAIAATPSAFTYAALGAAAIKPGETNWLTYLPAALGLLVTITLALRLRRATDQDQGVARVHARGDLPHQ